MDVKSGASTSEFWAMIIGKLMVVAVTAGVISTTQADSLTSNISTAVAGIFACMALAKMVSSYIESRTQIKLDSEVLANGKPTLPTSNPALGVAIGFIAMLGLVLTAAPVQAQQPKQEPHKTCFGWRNNQPRTDPALIAALNNISNNQVLMMGMLNRPQAVAPVPQTQIQPMYFMIPSAPTPQPQIIYQGPAPAAPPPPVVLAPQQPQHYFREYQGPTAPLQSLPIGGAPLQILPQQQQAPLQILPQQQQAPLQIIPQQQQAPLQVFPQTPQQAPLQVLPVAPQQQQAPIQALPVTPVPPTPIPPTVPTPIGATPPGGIPSPLVPPPAAPQNGARPLQPLPTGVGYQRYASPTKAMPAVGVREQVGIR